MVTVLYLSPLVINCSICWLARLFSMKVAVHHVRFNKRVSWIVLRRLINPTDVLYMSKVVADTGVDMRR